MDLKVSSNIISSGNNATDTLVTFFTGNKSKVNQKIWTCVQYVYFVQFTLMKQLRRVVTHKQFKSENTTGNKYKHILKMYTSIEFEMQQTFATRFVCTCNNIE